MKGFEIDSKGLMKCFVGDEVFVNVCFVVCYVNVVWNKVGVLYVLEDFIFE